MDAGKGNSMTWSADWCDVCTDECRKEGGKMCIHLVLAREGFYYFKNRECVSVTNLKTLKVGLLGTIRQ